MQRSGKGALGGLKISGPERAAMKGGPQARRDLAEWPVSLITAQKAGHRVRGAGLGLRRECADVTHAEMEKGRQYNGGPYRRYKGRDRHVDLGIWNAYVSGRRGKGMNGDRCPDMVVRLDGAVFRSAACDRVREVLVGACKSGFVGGLFGT